MGGARPARAGARAFAGQSALLAFLSSVSVPIILPYFWMVVIAFSARTGGVAPTCCGRLRGDRAGRSDLQRRPHVCRLAGAAARRRPRSCSRLPARCSRRWSAASCISTISASCGAPISSRRSRSKATAGGAVPIGLEGVPQFARAGGVADGDHPHRGLARRLLPLALRLPRPRRLPPGPAGAARLPGDDADHSDLPDAVLGRPARHAHRRHAGARRDRAAVLRLRDEGLLRRRALGHRDERDDRRRHAPPGVSPGRAAAGARRA